LKLRLKDSETIKLAKKDSEALLDHFRRIGHVDTISATWPSAHPVAQLGDGARYLLLRFDITFRIKSLNLNILAIASSFPEGDIIRGVYQAQNVNGKEWTIPNSDLKVVIAHKTHNHDGATNMWTSEVHLAAFHKLTNAELKKTIEPIPEPIKRDPKWV